MENEQLKQDLKNRQKNKRIPFFNVLIALVSIFHGEFISRVDGYLVEYSEPYIKYLPERFIGTALIILGVMKLVSILSDNEQLKKYSIWGLSSIWTGLFFIALTYSFGSGYPSPSWYFYFLVVAGCYHISRGDRCD